LESDAGDDDSDDDGGDAHDDDAVYKRCYKEIVKFVG
jgi:hypothetical protein